MIVLLFLIRRTRVLSSRGRSRRPAPKAGGGTQLEDVGGLDLGFREALFFGRGWLDSSTLVNSVVGASAS